MSYRDEEDSLHDGAPIEMYEFVLAGNTYRYTSSNTNLVYNNQVVKSVQIKHSNIKETQSEKKASISITLDSKLPLVKVLSIDRPDAILSVKILRRHEGDAQWVTYWRGTGATLTFGKQTTVIESIHLIVATTRSGLRTKYNRPCKHALYNTGSCRAQKQNFSHQKTVAAVDGRKITISNLTAGLTGTASIDDKYFIGGEIKVGSYSRFIEAQAGNVITVDEPLTVASGTVVTVTAGCDRSVATCKNKFNNEVNYGGMPTMPVKNLFDGSEGIA